MKLLSQTQALAKLHELKTEFASKIRRDYEHRAKSCDTCSTPGACCLDAHFVNVHITLLEAVAIGRVIDRFPAAKKSQIVQRVEETIPEYGLSEEGDTFANTYACPLFEKGIGCLVHRDAKPLPCITHACYENRNDLPPDELLAEQEGRVAKLNELTYRKPARWLPLPVAIRSAQSASTARPRSSSESAVEEKSGDTR